MARMLSPVDYTTSSSVWTQTDKWKGRMETRWIFVKDIPNSQLRHIRVWNNENKPVTNSRDTQELPPEAGLAMLRIFAEYNAKTSVVLQNLVAWEMKEEDTAKKRATDEGMEYVESGRQQGDNTRQRTSFMSDVGSSMRSSFYSTTTDDRPSRQSFQFEFPPTATRDLPLTNPLLGRRNTVAGVGSVNRTIASSTTPTSGMRNHEFTPTTTYIPPSRYDIPSTTTYRSVISNFASLGDSYRYPPFDHRHDEPRYF
jgi:YT521-B-like domain